ncbi:MAG: hypothetical protein V7607_6413, partial [Solirubrobacteraceae bacterium]
AGLAAAAIVTAGAVEVDHAAKRRPLAHRAAVTATATTTLPATPHVVASQAQPIADPTPAARQGEVPATKDATAKNNDKAKTETKTGATPATPATPTATPAVAPPQQGSATVTLPEQQTADTGAADGTDEQTVAPPPPPVDSGPADTPTPTQPDPTPPAEPDPTPPTGGGATTQSTPPADDPTQQQPAPNPGP